MLYIHARHGDGQRNEFGYPAVDSPIDTALWNGPYWGVPAGTSNGPPLLSRGAAHDLVIASALGEIQRV